MHCHCTAFFLNSDGCCGVEGIWKCLSIRSCNASLSQYTPCDCFTRTQHTHTCTHTHHPTVCLLLSFVDTTRLGRCRPIGLSLHWWKWSGWTEPLVVVKPPPVKWFVQYWILNWVGGTTLALVVSQACLGQCQERAARGSHSARQSLSQGAACCSRRCFLSSLLLFSLTFACLLRNVTLCLMVARQETRSWASSLQVPDRLHGLRSLTLHVLHSTDTSDP